MVCQIIYMNFSCKIFLTYFSCKSSTRFLFNYFLPNFLAKIFLHSLPAKRISSCKFLLHKFSYKKILKNAGSLTKNTAPVDKKYVSQIASTCSSYLSSDLWGNTHAVYQLLQHMYWNEAFFYLISSHYELV